MEIFKVGKKDGEIAVGQLKVAGDTAERQVSDVTANENEELKQAQALTGETVKKTVSNTEGGQVDESGETFNLGGEKEQAIVVKVDGPLSRLFTDSLNKVLAFESMVLIPLTEEQLEAMKENDPEYNDTTTIHVQAYDASDITTSDVVEISDAITKTDADDRVLVMESVRGIRGAADSAMRICAATKTRVHMQMRYAVETAMHVIRSKVA